MSNQPFNKFMLPKKNNAAIKEKFKQDKKTAKKEREAAINKFYEEKRALRQQENLLPANAPAKGFRDSKPAFNGKLIAPKKSGSTNKFKAPDMAINKTKEDLNKMPLNKFLAHCGLASRRDAIGIIKEGKVTVNNDRITEPGYKVTDTDVVKLDGKKLHAVKNRVYILLNKPKDYITTTDDPQGRKTVLDLIKQATSERVYPVGRLDRNTSGVLILTNDGELTQLLTHPSFNIKKVYEARLDKPLTKSDFDKILNGLKLDDGEIQADQLGFPEPKDKTIVGIEIHSGRNRIVRRIFEHLGYDVIGLDRVLYATLTKKNVPRGKWRFLEEREVRLLKQMKKTSFTPAKKVITELSD
ncbi:MAG: pseudouridine synthase [Ginsengibacter sp.]